MAGKDDVVFIENATIAFRNFGGRAGMYNAEGDRQFSVMLDSKLARDLESKGWKVKQLKVREEGDIPQDFITVSVKYRGRNGPVRPPTMVLISSRGRTNLAETECDILDQVELANVDMAINPYHWDVNGKTGVKPYLKAIYVTIYEDYLQQKYAAVPELNDTRASTLEDAKAIESGFGDEDDIVDADSWEVDDNQKALGR